MLFQTDIGADSLQQLNLEFTESEFFPLAFKPVVDNFTTDPFIPKDPTEIIASGIFNQVRLNRF